jgi:Family of unknown function (DUF6000)
MTKPPEISWAERHAAGATVSHISPVASLAVASDHTPPPQEFIERWIQPFYMQALSDPAKLERALRGVLGEIDESLIRQLLAYFDWRPRVVGAFFAAIRGCIGRLLLRSDVCYAGVMYCVALARFNTPSAVRYLREYLEHYLQQPDLWFDQQVALAALRFLDAKNYTADATVFVSRWQEFVANKPNWDLGRATDSFVFRMNTIEDLAARL